MRIVLDTSAIHGDYRMSGTALQVVLSATALTGDSVFVPQVVVDELVSQYQRELEAAVQKEQMVRSKLRRLLGGAVPPLVDPMVLLRESRGYREWLELRLGELGVGIVDLPNISHQALLKRLFARKKPFSADGKKGYRDALIWATVLNLAKHSGDDVVMVSNNTRDFAEKSGELHSDLALEAARVIGDEVSIDLEKSLVSLFDNRLKTSLTKLEGIKVQLMADSYSGFNVTAWLGEKLGDLLRDVDVPELDIPYEYDEPSVSYADVESATVREVEELSENSILITASVTANCEIDLFITKAEYWSTRDDEETVAVWDADWNKWVVAASTSARLDLLLWLRFDPASSSVLSSAVEEAVLHEGE